MSIHSRLKRARSRFCSGSPERHDGHVVVPGRSGAEVREVAEASAYERGGREFVMTAEQLAQAVGAVLIAALVARLGESVREEKERVARLHAKPLGRELLVAEDADGQSGRADERRVSPAQK